MLVALEILVALLVTYFFDKLEKPKRYFLFLGYVFFFVALLLRLPIKIAQGYLEQTLVLPYYVLILFPFAMIFITEVAKFLSLRTFMKTKSYKNGIFFGIGWASLEALTFISVAFYTFVLSYLPYEFPLLFAQGSGLSFFGFVVFFLVNIAATIFIVMAVIKKDYLYLAYSIVFVLGFTWFNQVLSGSELTLFYIVAFLLSMIVLFRYRMFR